MTTRTEAVAYCLSLPGAYEDHPFRDQNWTAMRRRDCGRTFAFLFERGGRLWMNVKCAPELNGFWRSQYAAVRPAYHMNKEHWISVVLDGTVPDAELHMLVGDSYRLVGGAK